MLSERKKDAEREGEMLGEGKEEMLGEREER